MADDEEHNEIPDWAKWLRRQLNGLNIVIAGVVVIAGTLAALWDYIPVIYKKTDCENYVNLEPHQQEECDAK